MISDVNSNTEVHESGKKKQCVESINKAVKTSQYLQKIYQIHLQYVNLKLHMLHCIRSLNSLAITPKEKKKIQTHKWT